MKVVSFCLGRGGGWALLGGNLGCQVGTDNIIDELIVFCTVPTPLVQPLDAGYIC